MLKDYYLGAEIAQQGNFEVSNISMALQFPGIVENVDYKKYGASTFLYKDCPYFPSYINDIIKENQLTDLSDYIPFPFFQEETLNKYKLIKDDINIIKIAGKKFVEFKTDFLKDLFLGDKTIYTIPKEELQELQDKNLIEGFIETHKDYVLVWY